MIGLNKSLCLKTWPTIILVQHPNERQPISAQNGSKQTGSDQFEPKPCPIGVYFNFARHTREPYRKMGSPIGHVWWLTSDHQAIRFASRTGKI